MPTTNETKCKKCGNRKENTTHTPSRGSWQFFLQSLVPTGVAFSSGLHSSPHKNENAADITILHPSSQNNSKRIAPSCTAAKEPPPRLRFSVANPHPCKKPAHAAITPSRSLTLAPANNLLNPHFHNLKFHRKINMAPTDTKMNISAPAARI